MMVVIQKDNSIEAIEAEKIYGDRASMTVYVDAPGYPGPAVNAPNGLTYNLRIENTNDLIYIAYVEGGEKWFIIDNISKKREERIAAQKKEKGLNSIDKILNKIREKLNVFLR